MIYLGTSGFSYDDWVGPFYPVGMPKKEWLFYYAREFNSCELNSTFYAIPSLSTMISLTKKTGEGFIFSVKLHQSITHQRKGEKDTLDKFLGALEPLVNEGKLGCVLAQFPYSFRPSPQNKDYLLSLKENFHSVPLVVELRNRSWLGEELFQWLRANEVGFCCVDEPRLGNLMPPVAMVTSKIAYLRFHGRNAAKWWHHQHAYERYDYSYSDDELWEWVPKIRKLDHMAERTFVFANNHWKGQAVETIRKLGAMLATADAEQIEGT